MASQRKPEPPEVEMCSQEVAEMLVILAAAGCTAQEMRAALRERNRTKEVAKNAE
jgi:hypothetical protein